MSALVVWGLCFGAGALLLLTAQSVGAPRASLAQRLNALRPDIEAESATEKTPVFRTRIFEEVLRPLLEEVGAFVASAVRRIGIGGPSLEAKLDAAGDPGGLALFMGQKVAGALIGFVLLPAAASLGVAPRLPMLVWLVFAVAGFTLPDAVLAKRLKSRRFILTEGIAQATEFLSLGVSSGLGMEQAIDEMAQGGTGLFFDELRRSLKDARLRGASAASALEAVADRTGMSEAHSLASAVQLAQQGAPLVQTLRAQAHSMRERRRLLLLEIGERAQVRMVLPVGVFILPAFFVLVLYPAAIQLLQVAGQ